MTAEHAPAKLRRAPAERAARAVLPACAGAWTAAEIMHVTGVPWLDIALGSAAAAGAAYGRGYRNAGAGILLAGGWSAMAARLGPMAGPYWPVTDAWALMSLWGWRWARRHPAVTMARDKRFAAADWLEKRHRWGLDGTHLLDWEETRLGEWYLVDVRGSGRRASQVVSSDVAERIAEDELLPPARVRLRRHRLAGRVEISVRRVDPWADPIPHPLLDDDPEIDLSGPYSITRPAVVGQDPETGRELELLLCGPGGGRNVNVVATLESGKALALDTPLPTPTGWTTMGDVRVGDYLLGQDGKAVLVTAATPVMHDHPCCDVEFSDGSVITADAEHLWLTETRAERAGRSKQTQSVRTTEQISRTLRDGNQSNHSIRNARPLQLPMTHLPVPPYTFGAWLGDGDSRGSGFTTDDPEIIASIEAEGVIAKKLPQRYRWRLGFPDDRQYPETRNCVVCGREYTANQVDALVCGKSCVGMAVPADLRGSGPNWRHAICRKCGGPCSGALPGYVLCRPCFLAHGSLQAELHTLGVLRDKHIPLSYLRSSVRQRRALLAGLLDTDGCIGKTGTIELGLTNKRLAEDARQLIASLGYSVSMTMKRVRGRSEASSTCYRLNFRAPDSVFRLARKAERQVGSGTSGRWSRRFISDVRPRESVPVRCIQVDNADELYLAGPTMIPTHNTTLLSCISERVTAAKDALLFRVNLSIKGDTERNLWAPACHLTALGPKEGGRALKLLRVIAGIVQWRAGQPRDTANWAPSPSDPHLVLIIDEIDALTEIPACRQVLEHLASKGREFGVTIVRAGQRGTAEWTGGGNIRAVDGVFVIGKVNRSMEAMHAAGDLGLALPNMAEYGDGKAGVWAIADLAQAGHAAGRGFNLSDPAGIRQIVAERAPLQPDLQPELKAFLGETYEELLSTDVYARWARDRQGRPPVVAHPRPDMPPEPEAEREAAPAPVAVLTADPLAALDAEAEEHMHALDETDPLRRRWLDQGRRNDETRRILAESAARPLPDISHDDQVAHAASRWRQRGEKTVIPDGHREQMLRLLTAGKISAGKIAEALGVSGDTARCYVERLRIDGLARPEGKGRAAGWVAAQPPEDGDGK